LVLAADGPFDELMNAMPLDSTEDMDMGVPVVDAEVGVALLDVVGQAEGAVVVVVVVVAAAVAVVAVA
jgi:hypothetical protein